MKLQILIPQYKETDAVIRPLLDSIAIQQNIDFSEIGAVIVNDGSEIFLTDGFLKSYPFRIEYYKEPHRGVSAARNACLDRAAADYVMFCDADDMFFNACGLWIVFREMEKGFDSLVSAFIEETREPKTRAVEYVTHDLDSTFVHGKIHRREYLTEKGIRFDDRLTVHEDSYFNILCQNLSKDVKYCTTAFYLWRWRDDSVCRHDPKYILKTYHHLIASNDALVEEFMRRGIHDKAMFYVAFMLFDAYYTMNKPEWIEQENREYRDDTERYFSAWYAKHKDMWLNIPLPDKMQISNTVRSRIVQEGMRMEAVTVDAWLRHIEKLGAGGANGV